MKEPKYNPLAMSNPDITAKYGKDMVKWKKYKVKVRVTKVTKFKPKINID